jgi:hypothetical protein
MKAGRGDAPWPLRKLNLTGRETERLTTRDMANLNSGGVSP